MIRTALLAGLMMTLACNPDTPQLSKEELIIQIRETEAAFNTMVAEDGVQEAFLYFADRDAVLNRNGKIIRGKEAIRRYFRDQDLKMVQLTWEPEFVDVSASGDLGYTYGPYQLIALDSAGNEIRNNGVFHTVWKKQADGKWRYVYD